MRERARLFARRCSGRACVCGETFREREILFYLNEKVRVKFRFFKILVGTIPRFFSLLRADDAPSRTDE